ncbi:GPW/gp25 family protein [Nannocystaceae bacterium ST9]
MSMAPRRSFIARLTRGPRRPESEAIARNLQHVLNTRKGSSGIMAFGLGDYEAAANTRDAVLMLLVEIEQLAIRHEPRLREPKVVLLGRHGYSRVRFELQGLVRGARQLFWLDLDTTTREVEVAIVTEPGR